jgi:hypothetical protein
LASDLPPADLSSHRAADVAFAAKAWTLRAEEEYRSAAVFAEIVAGVVDLGAPLDLLASLARIVDDEIAHSALCTDLSAGFGAPPPSVALEPVRARVASLGADRAHRTLGMLVFEGAVGETVSVALFRAGRRGTREPRARSGLSAILRDEARHAEVCWRAAAELLPVCSDALRAELERDVSRALGAFEQSAALPALRRLEAGEPFEPAWAELGVLPPDVRVEAFYGAIEGVALPRLARLGFDAPRAWADRYRV